MNGNLKCNQIKNGVRISGWINGRLGRVCLIAQVKLLVRDNERLQKRVEQLTEELNILHTLFSNVGVVPENIQREVAKHLEGIQHRFQ